MGLVRRGFLMTGVTFPQRRCRYWACVPLHGIQAVRQQHIVGICHLNNPLASEQSPRGAAAQRQIGQERPVPARGETGGARIHQANGTNTCLLKALLD